MEGSMRGSGIYSEEVFISRDCPNCAEIIEDYFMTDDWGYIDDWTYCPNCNEEVHILLSKEDYYG